MVERSQINPEVIELNLANLKRLKIGELREMLKEHTWKGGSTSVSSDLRLLIKYVIRKKNEYVSD